MRNIECDYKNIEPKVDCKWALEQPNTFASESKLDPVTTTGIHNLF
jgi:hypothetical protein